MSPRTPLPLLAKTSETRCTYAGTRIAGNQVLDKLPANEWTGVGVGKYVVECALQILLRGLARGQRSPIEKYFLRRVVLALDRHHGVVPVLGVVETGRSAAIWIGICPAGVGPRKRLYLKLGVGRNWIAAAIGLRCAVGIEKVQPQAEELHHLPAEVFIGDLPGGRLSTVHHVEIGAHLGERVASCMMVR